MSTQAQRFTLQCAVAAAEHLDNKHMKATYWLKDPHC
jgi:hypothetical protein